MAISYPLTIPTNPGFSDIRWTGQSSVENQIMPFTLHSKVYDWGGQIRHVEFSLPPMEVDDAKDWSAFILSLNGKEGSFLLGDSLNASPRGAVPDSYVGGQVHGSDQYSSSLISDGWPANTTDLFKAGDYISIANRLHTVLSDSSSSGSECSLDVWPAVTNPANNAPILVGSAARGTFQLTSWPDYGWTVKRLCEGVTISAREAI